MLRRAEYSPHGRGRPCLHKFENQNSKTALGYWFSAETVGLRDGSYEDVFVYEAASGFQSLLVEVEELLVFHEALDYFKGGVEGEAIHLFEHRS